jgi:dephospho-CoA kinase
MAPVTPAAAPPRPLLIGLTGGIGSGKSTVAQRLVALGAVLVDTDAIARALSAAGGSAIPALREAFGNEAIAADGSLNRERMRELAFQDASVKQRLEAILHPRIGQEAALQAQAAQNAGAAAIVFDVPLMHARSPWRERVHKLLVVDCEEATQLARVRARSGWSESAVRAAMAAQISRSERRKLADAVLQNEGLTVPELHEQVDALWALWMHSKA